MGSVQTKSGSDIMRLLTHEKWVYGIGTQSDKYNFMLFGKPNDKYLTVKRVIDLDNGSYSMQIFCDGNARRKSLFLTCKDKARIIRAQGQEMRCIALIMCMSIWASLHPFR